MRTDGQADLDETDWCCMPATFSDRSSQDPQLLAVLHRLEPAGQLDAGRNSLVCGRGGRVVQGL